MKLRQFVQNLNVLLEECPESAEFEVITADDDEGNAFHPVNYEPSAGTFTDGEFDADTPIEDYNAICVN